jgi:hypothetical protein
MVSKEKIRKAQFEVAAAPNMYLLNFAVGKRPAGPATATPSWWSSIPVRMIVK